MGDASVVRAELEALVAGPPKASVRDFATHLGKLSLHFWRPDFTPEQAKHLYGDFVTDLAGVTAEELAAACQEYRDDPRNSFFPTPGKLLALLSDGQSDRKQLVRGATACLEALCQEGAHAAGAVAPSSVAHGTNLVPDIGERLKKLGQQLSSGRVGAGSTLQTPPDAPKPPATGRASTDAAELKAALRRRTGNP